jgi:hypothetical protein
LVTGTGDRGGFLVRLFPFLGTLLLVLTFALPVAASTMLGFAGMQSLAVPSPLSLAILVCSLAFPLIAALGLWRAIGASDAGIFVRSQAALVSALLLVTAAYMASLGWIGVQTWTW